MGELCQRGSVMMHDTSRRERGWFAHTAPMSRRVASRPSPVVAIVFGNRYFENTNPEEEIPGRHRWVDYAQHEYNATQVPPEWHSWIHHIRKDPPTEDNIMQNLSPPWKTPWTENLTGTRGAFKTYNTTKPKYEAWEPKTISRGQSSV
ncbi:hypothetical protein NUW54_g6302 [Trametes sanguinea]|uniref:Uncharacterized protein n=1 Tax=Trametes sanguinea TaxID=158606 RepID=A0ACC1PVZ6_9APHY|nr:hypothetical protein NUW54_g6302 [Trametes sanguinea]